MNKTAVEGRSSADAQNNRHKPNGTVSGAIIITNGL